MVLNGEVLVLNQSFEPLHICNTRRALVLVLLGKAEVLEQAPGPIRSVASTMESPSVIRLAYHVKAPRRKLTLTRREIFRRDDYTCQYCGKITGDLTLDHVLPRSRGGKHTWENLVACCRRCNGRKGSKTPNEARMALLRTPREPRRTGMHLLGRSLAANLREEWLVYIPA